MCIRKLSAKICVGDLAGARHATVLLLSIPVSKVAAILVDQCPDCGYRRLRIIYGILFAWILLSVN